MGAIHFQKTVFFDAFYKKRLAPIGAIGYNGEKGLPFHKEDFPCCEKLSLFF